MYDIHMFRTTCCVFVTATFLEYPRNVNRALRIRTPSCAAATLAQKAQIDIKGTSSRMPSLAACEGCTLQVTAAPSSRRISRNSSTVRSGGLFELQLRRKLLQQQLGVVDQRCTRVAQVLAKKQLAKLPRQKENESGGGAHVAEPGRVGVKTNADTDHRSRRRRQAAGASTFHPPHVGGYDKRGKRVVQR